MTHANDIETDIYDLGNAAHFWQALDDAGNELASVSEAQHGHFRVRFDVLLPVWERGNEIHLSRDQLAAVGHVFTVAAARLGPCDLHDGWREEETR